jgi:hypothetical protein
MAAPVIRRRVRPSEECRFDRPARVMPILPRPSTPACSKPVEDFVLCHRREAVRAGGTTMKRTWTIIGVSDAIDYAKFYSRLHDAVIRVYDEAGNVIETHDHAGDFKEW